MNITIFGTGYVGLVSLACFAELGHNVTGIDVSKQKIDNLKLNQLPIFEKGLKKLILSNRKKKRISYDTNSIKSLQYSSCAIVCVGTPSKTNGSTNLKFILHVAEEIAINTIKKKNFKVIFRSTIPPKTIEKKIIPIFKKYKNKSQIIFHPEFLREGTAINDFFSPSRVVFGFNKKPDINFIKKLYKNNNQNFSILDYKSAELIKYVDNLWHATKVVFANEVARLGLSENINPSAIMECFIQDKKLNISEKYLRPGNAFGGSCLPKDVASINYISRKNKIMTPLFSSIEKSNNNHIDLIYKQIKSFSQKKIGFYGISFKPDTDDCRESPIIKIISKLIKNKNKKIMIYDSKVQLSKLMGGNKKYLESLIKNPEKYFCHNLNDLFEFSEIIITNKKTKIYKSLRKDIKIIRVDSFFN